MKKLKLPEPYVTHKHFVRKLYCLLDTRPEIFKVNKLKGYTAGHCFVKPIHGVDKIEVDPKYDVISVLIHEVIHFYYHDWSEEEVLWHEAYYIKVMSARQLRNILKRFASIL